MYRTKVNLSKCVVHRSTYIGMSLTLLVVYVHFICLIGQTHLYVWFYDFRSRFWPRKTLNHFIYSIYIYLYMYHIFLFKGVRRKKTGGRKNERLKTLVTPKENWTLWAFSKKGGLIDVKNKKGIRWKRVGYMWWMRPDGMLSVLLINHPSGQYLCTHWNKKRRWVEWIIARCVYDGRVTGELNHQHILHSHGKIERDRNQLIKPVKFYLILKRKSSSTVFI